VYNAAIATLPHRQPAPREYGKHRLVPGQNVGFECDDSTPSGNVHQMAQQAACDTESTVVFFHDEGNFRSAFGALLARCDVAPRGDYDFLESAARRYKQCHVAIRINRHDPA
jgi:hypothetical protein